MRRVLMAFLLTAAVVIPTGAVAKTTKAKGQSQSIGAIRDQCRAEAAGMRATSKHAAVQACVKRHKGK